MQTGEKPRKTGTGAAMLLAAAAAVLVYAASLPGSFQYDDLPTILQNPSVTDPGLLGEYFTDPSHFSGTPGNGMYRPVLLLTFLADHSIAGYSPLVWHLTNVLLHGLNAALVVLLATMLLRTLGAGPPRRGTALLAGLAFGLHPVHSEVVNYISARSGALATAGFLGALILHLVWTRSSRPRWVRSLALVGSAALFLSGLGAKEIAIALLPVVICLELLDPAGRRWRRAAVRVLPVLIAAVLYFQVRAWAMDGATLGSIARRMAQQKSGGDLLSGGGRTPWENLLTQSRVFWVYARLILVPVGLAVDRFVRVSTSPFEPAVLASIAGILLLGWLLWRERGRRPFLTLAGVVVFAGLAPTSSFLPLNVVMNEHRLYLPGVGVALAAGWFAAGLRARWPRAGTAALACVFVAFGALATMRSLVWQDARTLWESNVGVSPDSYRAHNQLGSESFGEAARIGSKPPALPHLAAAIASYERAIELYPRWYDPHLNLGIAFRERARITGNDADWERAIREFEECLALAPAGGRARYQLATTYGVRGDREEAIRRFSEMAEADRDPSGRRLPLYLFPMARLEQERGRPEAAEALYREILLRDPGDVDAHAGVAKALAASGRPEEGAAMLRDLMGRRPDDPVPCLALAEFLLELDPPDRRGAGALFQRALSLGYQARPADFEKYLK